MPRVHLQSPWTTTTSPQQVHSCHVVQLSCAYEFRKTLALSLRPPPDHSAYQERESVWCIRVGEKFPGVRINFSLSNKFNQQQRALSGSVIRSPFAAIVASLVLKLCVSSILLCELSVVTSFMNYKPLDDAIHTAKGRIARLGHRNIKFQIYLKFFSPNWNFCN